MSKSKAFYIANCIERAVRAGSDNPKRRRLMEDIAEAVSIAANEGIDAAHKHLMMVCDAAESGLYFTKELPEGFDAFCRGCGHLFTLKNAKAVNTQDWQRFCSPSCQKGVTNR